MIGNINGNVSINFNAPDFNSATNQTQQFLNSQNVDSYDQKVVNSGERSISSPGKHSKKPSNSMTPVNERFRKAAIEHNLEKAYG